MQVWIASPAGIATSVWTVGSRTLTADPASPAAIAGRQALAAGTVLDLRPAAGAFRRVSAACIAVSGAGFCGLYDGTNFDQENAQTSEYVGVYSGFGNSTRGLSVKNTTASSQTVSYCGYDLT